MNHHRHNYDSDNENDRYPDSNITGDNSDDDDEHEEALLFVQHLRERFDRHYVTYGRLWQSMRRKAMVMPASTTTSRSLPSSLQPTLEWSTTWKDTSDDEDDDDDTANQPVEEEEEALTNKTNQHHNNNNINVVEKLASPNSFLTALESKTVVCFHVGGGDDDGGSDSRRRRRRRQRPNDNNDDKNENYHCACCCGGGVDEDGAGGTAYNNHNNDDDDVYEENEETEDCDANDLPTNDASLLDDDDDDDKHVVVVDPSLAMDFGTLCLDQNEDDDEDDDHVISTITLQPIAMLRPFANDDDDDEPEEEDDEHDSFAAVHDSDDDEVQSSNTIQQADDDEEEEEEHGKDDLNEENMIKELVASHHDTSDAMTVGGGDDGQKKEDGDNMEQTNYYHNDDESHPVDQAEEEVEEYDEEELADEDEEEEYSDEETDDDDNEEFSSGGSTVVNFDISEGLRSLTTLRSDSIIVQRTNDDAPTLPEQLPPTTMIDTTKSTPRLQYEVIDLADSSSCGGSSSSTYSNHNSVEFDNDGARWHRETNTPNSAVRRFRLESEDSETSGIFTRDTNQVQVLIDTDDDVDDDEKVELVASCNEEETEWLGSARGRGDGTSIQGGMVHRGSSSRPRRNEQAITQTAASPRNDDSSEEAEFYDCYTGDQDIELATKDDVASPAYEYDKQMKFIVDDDADDEDSEQSSEKENAAWSTRANLNKPQRSLVSQRVFRKNRDVLTTRTFQEFDTKVFGGQLASVVSIKWSPRLRTTAGINRSSYVSGNKRDERQSAIELSTKCLTDETRLRCTLMHELCHAAAWVIDGVTKPPHGRCFQKWANLAMQKVKDVEVTTTHDYEIHFKYSWACMTPGCGVIVGRHSRSMDLSRHRCAKCKGPFTEIEPNGSSDSTAVPRKKAPLSAYNVFVQSHTQSVRKRLEDDLVKQGLDPVVSQKEVMTECGRLWRKQKHQE